MNFASFQRFAPLLSFATKRSADLSDADLSSVAQALAGVGADDMMPFLTALRNSEPEQRVVEILASDTARKWFKKFKEDQAAEPVSIFCRCPLCQGRFEIEVDQT